MSRLSVRLLLAAGSAVLCGGTAAAQLLPNVGLPPVALPQPLGNAPIAGPVLQDVLGGLNSQQARQAISPTLDSVAGLPNSVAQAGDATLLEIRRLRLQQLIRDNSNLLEADAAGEPVRRGVLLAIDPDPTSLQLVQRGGFTILADERDPVLGMRTVQLAVPRGLTARAALERLQSVAPQLRADFDHLFEPAGEALAPSSGPVASTPATGRGPVIGMIDGGVASHPSLRGAKIEQNGFAGAPQPTGHGTAVASLLVGSDGPFRGEAVGARLYVADVYGGSRAAGSASAIIRALGWLAAHRPQVINISLVGPGNRAVQRAIQIVQSRGIQVVAAVGNDGPAAPPQYPASYPGVIAITAVDAHGRALPEAGRATHLDFAAPGADMAAALPGTGYARVRGTSFAAPLAAARLLSTGSPARLAMEARPGRGRLGRGIVCWTCRVDPKVVRAK